MNADLQGIIDKLEANASLGVSKMVVVPNGLLLRAATWLATLDGVRNPGPLPNTRRVRVAVAIDHAGFWSARGWDDIAPRTGEAIMAEQAQEAVDTPSSVYWIEADIPLIPTVQGHVVEGKA